MDGLPERALRVDEDRRGSGHFLVVAFVKRPLSWPAGDKKPADKALATLWVHRCIFALLPNSPVRKDALAWFLPF